MAEGTSTALVTGGTHTDSTSEESDSPPEIESVLCRAEEGPPSCWEDWKGSFSEFVDVVVDDEERSSSSSWKEDDGSRGREFWCLVGGVALLLMACE